MPPSSVCPPASHNPPNVNYDSPYEEMNLHQKPDKLPRVIPRAMRSNAKSSTSEPLRSTYPTYPLPSARQLAPHKAHESSQDPTNEELQRMFNIGKIPQIATEPYPAISPNITDSPPLSLTAHTYSPERMISPDSSPSSYTAPRGAGSPTDRPTMLLAL